MNTVLENLQKARDLIAKPEHWVVGTRHCDRAKRNGSYAHCALGAIEAAMGAEHLWGADNCCAEVVALSASIPNKEVVKDVSPDSHDARVAAFNNRTNHATVLAWFDRAIAIQKEHPTEKVG